MQATLLYLIALALDLEIQGIFVRGRPASRVVNVDTNPQLLEVQIGIIASSVVYLFSQNKTNAIFTSRIQL